MRMEAIRKTENNEACCPTCGGGVYRRTFGEMHAGSYVHDGKRVDIRRKPKEGFQNPIILDSITQYFMGGIYRMWPSERYLAKGGKRLHRDAWEAAFGKIPKGCHIHHRDANPLNNSIENLECIEPHHHNDETHKARKARGEKYTFSNLARERAAAWHKSEEGREWHRQHAKKSQGWKKWKREPRPCLYCGVEFDCLIRANGHQQKFCTTNCRAAHYRKRVASGG